MVRSRRFAILFALALFTLGGVGLAQSISVRSPGFRTPSPTASVSQAPACGPTFLTQSTSTTVTDLNSVSCNANNFHTDNHYWRAFDLSTLGVFTDYNVCAVTIGVQSASSSDGTQPITVNLYTSSPAFPGGTLTPIGTVSTTVADQSLSLVTFPVTGTAPKGSELVVEIFTPNGIADGNSFFIGSNAAGESGPSYLSAADCGIPEPTTTADLNHPEMHIVMGIDGTALGPRALDVDPVLQIVNDLGNGVLEMGEAAVIAPTWENGNLTDIGLTGVASNLTGPFNPGTNYAINDSSADYGTIEAASPGTCADCYAIQITGNRPAFHFDAQLDETVTVSPLTLGGAGDTVLKTWTLHVGESFADVNNDIAVNPFYPFIETLFHYGVTSGCGGNSFCPLQNNLRQEIAVFLLKDLLGAGYVPPACTGVFADVPCPATPEFPYSNFVEDLFTRGITTGCQVGPPALFCPGQGVTRAQMAPLLLKTLLTSSYTPPNCTGIFADVPCPATPQFPFSNFIEDLAVRGVTAGCAVGPPALFCPDAPVTREQMAAFLSLTFSLALYGP